MGEILDSTLDLVAKTGWRIFPSIGKQPALKNWPNACSSDPDVIRGWFRQFRDMRPSLVTGPRNGVIVLDIDVGIDRDGNPYSGFDGLEEKFGWTTMPPTPCVHTKRGGCHLYFRSGRLPDNDVLDDRHPAHARAIKNSVSVLAPHVDVRGWNGQVILPVAGSGYTIDPALNFDIEMINAPSWFNHRQRRKYNKLHNGHFDPDAILADACREIARAPEGQRHDTFRHQTFKIARLVGLGLIPRDKAYFELQAEVMTLGMRADGRTQRVEKYFEMAWSEGLNAGKENRR